MAKKPPPSGETIGLILVGIFGVVLFFSIIGWMYFLRPMMAQRAYNALVSTYSIDLLATCQNVRASESENSLPVEGSWRVLILHEDRATTHPLHEEVYQPRRADAAANVDYVVCIAEEAQAVEPCTTDPYGGSSFRERIQNRIQHNYSVRLIDVETNTTIGRTTLNGTEFGVCGRVSFELDEYEVTTHGDPPGVDAVLSWIASVGAVTPTPLLTATPRP